MRKSKRLDPALLNELIDELIAQAGSDDEQICQGVRFVIDDVRAKVSWEKSMANEL